MSDMWKISEELLAREFKFKNFPDAMSFMFLAAFEAEKINHHPEWKNIYNRVFVELVTHDAAVLRKGTMRWPAFGTKFIPGLSDRIGENTVLTRKQGPETGRGNGDLVRDRINLKECAT